MTSTRQLALGALVAIDEGQRAAAALGDVSMTDLAERDRGFITELVNGTTRMRRACDEVAAPFLKRRLDPDVQAAVRMGVHQLVHLRTPPHAAVHDTVEAAPKRARGLVNAVLRRVSEVADPQWSSPAAQHSYPDWLWDLAVSQWGDDGAEALVAMNTPERPQPRPDGFVQGRASRWVTEALDRSAPDGGLLLDLCAAPGGKTTGVGSQWTTVVGCELDAVRVDGLRSIVGRYRESASVVRADGVSPPFRPGSADAVLLDAPCSGLGALGRRSDARWSLDSGAVGRLVPLQRQLVEAAYSLVRPGGVMAYSVCTFTHQETTGVIDGFLSRSPEAMVEPVIGDHWRVHGRGALVWPQDHDTDAMALFVVRKPH